jgi:hypothetical protein
MSSSMVVPGASQVDLLVSINIYINSDANKYVHMSNHVCTFIYIHMYVLQHGRDGGFSSRSTGGLYIICMLTLLLMPLAGLHFCVGLDFVTPLVVIFLK